MSRKRLLATSAGTVGCAIAIGFFMQQGSNAPAQKRDLAPEPVVQAELPKDTAKPSPEDPVLDLVANDVAPESPDTVNFEDITLTSVNAAPTLENLATTILDSVAFDPEPDLGDGTLSAPSDPEILHLGCEIRAMSKPVEMASVRVTIDAPCNGNERVTLHHTGMIFTAVTSDEGRLVATIPALAETAVFVAEFDNGDGVVATATVPDIDDFDRVALQWTGATGFQIHAREFGAAYGSPGHVWSGHRFDEETGNGGVMTRLGDLNTLSPNVVEVYTFPRKAATQAGTVALTVEAEVTEANCGRDIAAQSIELHGQSSLRTQDLILSMPDCSAIGDFLVLNNLVDDLKIAAR